MNERTIGSHPASVSTGTVNTANLPVIHGVAIFMDDSKPNPRTVIQRTKINPETGFPSMLSDYFAQDVMILRAQDERGQIVQQQHQYEFPIPNTYSVIEAFRDFDKHRQAGAAAEINKLKKAQLGRVG